MRKLAPVFFTKCMRRSTAVMVEVLFGDGKFSLGGDCSPTVTLIEDNFDKRDKKKHR
jgi:hypothetical protein